LSKAKVERVICYRIQNLLDLSAIEALCTKKNVGFSAVQTISELTSSAKSPDSLLILCDLSTLTSDEVQSLAKVSRELGAKTFGFFPHVSQEIRSTGKEQRIDYIVPRSAFRAKLETLLG
jgi:hypothetical protein